MKTVYVNGQKHRNVRDALLTTGGTYNGFAKAMNSGLTYHGFTLSHDPPEIPEARSLRRASGPLIRFPHRRISP